MSLELNNFRGQRAKEILENEEFQAAFEAIKTELINQWEQSPLRDNEGREKIHQYLTMLNKVKAQITSVMETGRLAQLELDHKRNISQRAKDAIRQFSDPY